MPGRHGSTEVSACMSYSETYEENSTAFSATRQLAAGETYVVKFELTAVVFSRRLRCGRAVECRPERTMRVYFGRTDARAPLEEQSRCLDVYTEIVWLYAGADFTQTQIVFEKTVVGGLRNAELLARNFQPESLLRAMSWLRSKLDD